MTTRKYFKNRNAMLHFVASVDYEDDVIYYTDGGKTWFYNNVLYRNNISISFVDREEEQVCRNVSLAENTSLWRYMRELSDAFKHYEPIDLTSFDIEDAVNILDKSFLSIKAIKNPSYYQHKAYVLAYKTVLFLSTYTDSKERVEQYKKSLKFVKDEDKRKEEEKKAYEKAVKEYHAECYKAIEKYIPKVLKGKNWNEKLKNFPRDGINISLKEWKELNALSIKEVIPGRSLYQDVFSVNGPIYGRREDGTRGYLAEYPEKPTLYIKQSVLNDMKGLPDYADFLYLDNDHIKTTRGIDIDDSSKLVRILLKKFIKSSEEDRQKFIGLHVGSFVIREWNPEQRYLQIGCHRFYEQTLKEFADFIKEGK